MSKHTKRFLLRTVLVRLVTAWRVKEDPEWLEWRGADDEEWIGILQEMVAEKRARAEARA